MLIQWGCLPKVYPIVKDRLSAIEETLRKAVDECDAVILNAGSSAGSEDYSAQAMRSIGEVVLHGIAIKPGKPAVLGLAQTSAQTGLVPVLGVPGYPVSGILVLEHVFQTGAGAAYLPPAYKDRIYASRDFAPPELAAEVPRIRARPSGIGQWESHSRSAQPRRGCGQFLRQSRRHHRHSAGYGRL